MPSNSRQLYHFSHITPSGQDCNVPGATPTTRMPTPLSSAPKLLQSPLIACLLAVYSGTGRGVTWPAILDMSITCRGCEGDVGGEREGERKCWIASWVSRMGWRRLISRKGARLVIGEARMRGRRGEKGAVRKRTDRSVGVRVRRVFGLRRPRRIPETREGLYSKPFTSVTIPLSHSKHFSSSRPPFPPVKSNQVTNPHSQVQKPPPRDKQYPHPQTAAPQPQTPAPTVSIPAHRFSRTQLLPQHHFVHHAAPARSIWKRALGLQAGA